MEREERGGGDAPRHDLSGTRLVHYGPAWDADLEQTKLEADGPVAVLVCHGMGQQVRYETIGSVAACILKESKTADPVQVHLAVANDDYLARAEIQWTDEQNRQHEVHVYEAYWAPLTEGRVTYWDTIKFLLLAAWNGLRWSKAFRASSFERWMFDGKKRLEIGNKTFLGLLCVLGFLLLQVGIIGYVSIEIAHRLKDTLAQPLPSLTGGRAWIEWLVPLLPAGSAALLRPASVGSLAWFTAVFHLLGWLTLIGEAFFVRYFLVEFVGDVAAYVSPYKDSKFDELRHRIQKIGFEIGKLIYGFGASAAAVPKYSKVVIVGHSLGSVLAYDTLNALINMDNICGDSERRGVAKRTRALITFGSPLDKTAFIFRMQPHGEQNWIREQLVASVQPLIVSYKLYRPESFTWVNIWSPQDVISGELNYYDDPGLKPDDPRRVQNMTDPDARIPFRAHVQYWNNRRLREELFKYVS